MWQASSDRKIDGKMRAISKRKTRIGQLVQTDTTKYYVNVKQMAGEVVVEKQSNTVILKQGEERLEIDLD